MMCLRTATRLHPIRSLTRACPGQGAVVVVFICDRKSKDSAAGRGFVCKKIGVCCFLHSRKLMDLTEQQQRFAEWTRDYGAILHHVVNGFAAPDDRKDLLQEVLLAVWKSIPRFRGQAKPTTYLYRVSHNAALLWIRTQKNYRRRVEQFGVAAPRGFVTDPDSLT